MYCTISREYWFSAAHQLEGHPKCGRLHGHNYKVVVAVSNRSIVNGMVIDFGELDKIVKPIVDELDHRYIVSRANFDARNPIVTFARSMGHSQDESLWNLEHSTAELLAEAFYNRLSYILHTGGIQIEYVSVQETEKSLATYK